MDTIKSGMAARRELNYVSFEDLLADLRRIKGSQFRTVGNWSLGQICDHLGIFFTRSMEGFGFRMPWYVRIGGPLILKMTLRRRRIPAGVKGPAGLMPAEAASIEDARAVEGLIEVVGRYRAFTGEFEPSPLFGRLTRGQWDQVHLIHCAHHLSFVVPGE